LGKRDAHRADLEVLLGAWQASGSPDDLWQYIITRSNLPGRRGNLELAAAWYQAVEAAARQGVGELWSLVIRMATVPASEAPVNDPREMIAFCGALGIGAVGVVDEAHSGDALQALRAHARDQRWRMREAVAMALQHMLQQRTEMTLAALEQWVSEGNWLEMRAVAAAVAEPSVLAQKDVALAALRLHEGILAAMARATDRRAEAFRVLRKGLGYTLSVVTSRLPEEGIRFLKMLVASGDPDTLAVVKQNLRKKRLAGAFAGQVEELEALTVGTGAAT
jgi:hypothetical protein